MDTPDAYDYDYPQETPEVVEQVEADQRAEMQSAERLAGIQSWLKGDVSLEESGITDTAAETRLIEEVEQARGQEAGRVAEAAATRAAADAQRESAIEAPSYASELRESSNPEGALAEAQAESAAMRARHEAMDAMAEQLQEALRSSPPPDTGHPIETGPGTERREREPRRLV